MENNPAQDTPQKEEQKTSSSLTTEKDEITRERKRHLLALFLVFFLLLTFLLVMYRYYLMNKTTETETSESTNNTLEQEVEVLPTEVVVEEEEKVAKTYKEILTGHSGNDLLFWSKSVTDSFKMNVAVYDIDTQEKLVSRSIKTKQEIYGGFGEYKAEFNSDNGDFYFITREVLIDEFYEMSPCMEMYEAGDCKQSLFKASVLGGSAIKLYESEKNFSFTLSPTNDFIIISETAGYAKPLEIKKLNLSDNSITLVKTINDIEEEFKPYDQSYGEVSTEGTMYYQVYGKYSPDVLNQKSVLRILDLGTGAIVDKTIPGLKTTALANAYFSPSYDTVAISSDVTAAGEITTYQISTGITEHYTTADFDNVFLVWKLDEKVNWLKRDNKMWQYRPTDSAASILDIPNPSGVKYIPVSASDSGQFLHVYQFCVPSTGSCTDADKDINKFYDYDSGELVSIDSTIFTAYRNSGPGAGRIVGYEWFIGK